MQRFALVLLASLAALGASGWLEAEPSSGSSGSNGVDFNRDIRPILSDNCFRCHGPDEKQLKAKLRLDLRESAIAERPGGAAIVPGHAGRSQLIERLVTEDEEARMPPAKAGKRLSPQQIELLKKWIDDGADYSQHWAFVRPIRPPVPAVATLARNPIDNFIQARLAREGLQPSPEANRTTLIRRVTLDLTGLPPTLAEIEAFLNDQSESAYEDLVERLLASPRYGEHMAQEWLDAARYADTHGYHIDSGRDMTRWREWVIEAFNANKPFDEFTVEQLAGDLLPNATFSQKIASGFNRNHMINFEGGAIPEEYHTAYIVDRVNTTGTVWLGMTVACAQCHEHKYDPLSQKEYYQLFAFFYNVPENGLDGSKGNAPPLLKVPTPRQQEQLDALAAEASAVEARLASPDALLDAEQAAWEKNALAQAPPEWSALHAKEHQAAGGGTFKQLDDGSLLIQGPNPSRETYSLVLASKLSLIRAIRLEVLPHDSFPSKGPGRSVNGNIVLTNVEIRLGAADAPPLRIRRASADFSQDNFPIELAIDDKPESGWAIFPQVGKAHQAIFELAEPLTSDELKVTLDFQSVFGQHQPGRIRLSATASDRPHEGDTLPAGVRAVLAIPAEQRNEAQRRELRDHFRRKVSAAGMQLAERLAQLKKEQAELDHQIPSTMIMQEMPKPRDTYVLIRGEYDKKGEKVSAGVPGFLHPFQADPSGRTPNRLDLARWLTDLQNPLTPRVIVNRWWQMLFGTGLVKTSEDFGSQGEWPSHPELLDWLAVELIDSGWDVKHMIRLMVTSATYRQASTVTPQHLARDPENRLLARASRLRLSAEAIRDQALAVSGLLYGEIGGKSVSPYQPEGLWEELMSRADGKNWTAQTYEQSHGRDLYRRTMYTFWKRTCPPPTLATFDAPDRETCTVRRARTNTPLQALILMNDPTYVEASRKLAERLLHEAESTVEARIALAFRLTTARLPTPQEVAVLQRVYHAQRQRFTGDRPAALKLLTTGESPWDERFDPIELAAWAMAASVVLNLDEVVTRG